MRDIVLSKNYSTFMYISCLLYCAAAMPMLGIASDFKTVIMVGSLPVLFIKYKSNEIDKNIVKLLIVSIVIQVISWINSLFAIPLEAKGYPDVKLLTSLFLFAWISMWINGDKRKQRLLYIVLIVSFIVTAIYDMYVNGSLAIALSGERIDYGMHNAQYTTMMSAVLIMLAIYLVSTKPKQNRTILDFALAGFVICFAIFSLIVSQSRQIWLGLLVLGAVFPIMYAMIYKTEQKIVGSLYIVICLLVVAFASNESVQKRVMRESDVTAKIVQFEWDDIPMTSIGIRFNSWIEAAGWIKEHPVVGTSKESIRLVTERSEKFQESGRTRQFKHLHNYYLETLVAFGIVGIIFLIYFYKQVTLNVLNYANKSSLLFYSSFLLFWLVINNFESFNAKYYGLYIHSIILAGLFSMNKIHEDA
jgi:O-antigen ligase